MKFTPSHEWIKVVTKIGTVGITTHGQKELGEIVYLELPKIGSRVKAGEEVVVLESTKAAADIYSPVSGKIIAVNESLKKEVQKINHHPEEGGWLYQIELEHPEELDTLLDKEEYLDLIMR